MFCKSGVSGAYGVIYFATTIIWFLCEWYEDYWGGEICIMGMESFCFMVWLVTRREYRYNETKVYGSCIVLK